MEPIQWSTWMSVGVEELDDDHRVLVGIVNKLAIAENRADATVVGEILDELIAYTRHHFAAEEGVMRQAGYPTFPAHKRLHDELTRQVEAYRDEFRARPGAISGEDVFGFCADWLGRHILREDTRFGEYAASHAGAIA